MSKKPFVLTISNQKGGVSKTSTTLNLSYALAKKGEKVLIIDMDSQGSAGLNLGIQVSNDDINTIELLLDPLVNNPNKEIPWEIVKEFIYTPTFADRKRDPENQMKWVDTETPFGVDIIPSSLDLSIVELKMGIASGVRKEGIRTDYLSKIIDVIAENSDYTFIIIDTPPALGALSMNAVGAAKDGIIIVSNLDMMSIRGISTFIETAETVKKIKDEHRGVLGILFCLYSERRVIDRSIDEWVKEFLPIPTFDTRIPESSSFKKANSALLLASQIDKKIEKAFMSFADEVIYAVNNPNELIGSARTISEKTE